MRILVAAAVVLWCVPAIAAPADPDIAKAKTIFAHAETLYALTKYDQALAEYEKAFEVKPLPGFLFNIGQCHRQLGHFEQAAQFYRSYLERSPEARNHDLVQSLIVEMDEEAKNASEKMAKEAAQLEQQRERDRERAREEDRERERQRQIAEHPIAAPVVVVSPVAPPPPVVTAVRAPLSAETGRKMEIAGVVVAAAGLVALGTGIALGLRAASLSDTLSRLAGQGATWSDDYRSQHDEGARLAVAATVLDVVGAVVLGAGAIAALVGWRAKAAARRLAIAPLVGGGMLVGSWPVDF